MLNTVLTVIWPSLNPSY